MKKKIAVFANGYGLDSLKALIRGFRSADADNEYDIFVFFSYASYDEFEEFNRGELNIYDLPDLKDYDALIVLSNSLNSIETGITLVKRAVEAGVPVFSVGIEVEGAINIILDNESGMRELAKHLIEVHDVRRAAIIGGYKTHPESICRIDTVRQVFEEHGRPIPEDNIYYGDWGNFKTLEVARRLAEDPAGLPDAIIACNDIMALACATELTRLGYKLPGDVIVTGYDYVPKGQSYYPVLTTVDTDFTTIGKVCHKTITDFLSGKGIEKNQLICSKLKIGESCRCLQSAHFDERRREQGKATYSDALDRESLDGSERALTQLISYTDEYGELTKKLVEYYSNDHDFVGNNFHIVIHSKYFTDVMADEQEVFEDGFDDGPMQSVVSVNSRGEVSAGAPANRHDLVPGYNKADKESHVFFLFPLHTGLYNYGFVVIDGDARITREYLDLHAYVEKFMLAFRIQRSNIQLKFYNDSLRKISEIDTMTGLYNRLGYENKATPIYENCKRSGSRLMVMFIDINRMKRINDVFGHINGDAAIRLTASAIKTNLRDGWIAVRFGGDEFLIIGGIKNKEAAESFRSDVLASVDKFNHEGNWPFRLSVSSGFIISEEGDDKPLTEYIKDADNLMYETKKKMHSER
ncbi:MAG: diguanylate cyclase [Saccharofermentans sp.]|nr:diguanylate cyclase [Saccharofermentans sp.]